MAGLCNRAGTLFSMRHADRGASSISFAASAGIRQTARSDAGAEKFSASFLFFNSYTLFIKINA